MLRLNISGKEYKVKFGYNSFCDTDLLDRVIGMAGAMFGEGNADGVGQIKELFLTVRELLFVGFKKYNPVDSIQEVGELLDNYIDEAEEGEDRGVLAIFNLISEELANEGFLASLFSTAEQEQKKESKPKVVKK